MEIDFCTSPNRTDSTAKFTTTSGSSNIICSERSSSPSCSTNSSSNCSKRNASVKNSSLINKCTGNEYHEAVLEVPNDGYNKQPHNMVPSIENSSGNRSKNKEPVQVYNDGVFDLVHAGHFNALRQAATLGDRLIVGVVSDEEVFVTKGTYPVYSEIERGEIIANCKWVDKVVLGVPYAVHNSLLDKLGCQYCSHGDDDALTAEGVDSYEEPRKSGRLKIFRRTHGISTTTLMSRLLYATKQSEGSSSQSADESKAIGEKGDSEATSTYSMMATPSVENGIESGRICRWLDGGDGGRDFGNDSGDCWGPGSKLSPSWSPVSGSNTLCSFSKHEKKAVANMSNGGQDRGKAASVCSTSSTDSSRHDETLIHNPNIDCRGSTIDETLIHNPNIDPSTIAVPRSRSTTGITSCDSGSSSDLGVPAQVLDCSSWTSTHRLMKFIGHAKQPRPTDKIIYIDGSFDIFHVGHVRILNKAKALGDFLIVGVHDDATVQRVKGPRYPIVGLLERCLNVLAMRMVDEVVIGAPWQLTQHFLKSFKIDVVVRGTRVDMCGGAEGHSYSEDEDNPYELPKLLGMYRELESSSSVTTWEIVQRIKANRGSISSRVKKRGGPELECLRRADLGDVAEL